MTATKIFLRNKEIKQTMAEIKYDSTSVTQEVIKRTIQDYAPNAISNKGGYTYINGSLIPNALSRIIARALRVGRIIRPGIGMTEEFAASIDPAQILNITVQLQNNMGVHVRTLRDGDKGGTPNNDGMINVNRKLIPSTTPFNIPVRQIVDAPIFFPRLKLETMVFDEIAETLGNYLDNETNAIDSYHIAKMIAYAMYRAAENQSGTATDPSTYGDNVIAFDTSTAYDDLSAVKLINQLNAVMSNGDKQTQLGTFKGRRQLTLRNELLGYLRSPKTGYVSNTERGASIFYEPGFDLNETMREGEQYRGGINGYEMYEMTKETLDLACEWLGLEAGALDGVLGIVSTPLSYAGGGVGKKAMYMLQSTEYDGVVTFPFTKFGGTAYRKIFLIVSSTWTVPTKLQSKLAPAFVVAPERWASAQTEPIERVIYDGDGNATGTEVIADVIAPNGDTTCAVTIRVTGTGGVALNNATLTPTVSGATVGYMNNMDGTYTIVVPKGSTISGSIAVSGYTSGSISVTAAQTKKWNYNTTVALTASD